MKKYIALGLLFCSPIVFAGDMENEISDRSIQVIEMEENKINVIVMKQPLNEKSNQKIMLKRNWLGVYVQINGKVKGANEASRQNDGTTPSVEKVNPLTSTYEVQ